MSRHKGVSGVFVLLCLGLFAYGCGGDDGPSQEQLDKARAEGAKEAREQAKVEQLQKEIKQLQQQNNRAKTKNRGGGQGQSGGSEAGGPVSDCGGGVRVGPNTSCEFAMNVAGEQGSNPYASTIRAYSPKTHQYYTMTCEPWSGGGTVCTGGDEASVYLP